MPEQPWTRGHTGSFSAQALCSHLRPANERMQKRGARRNQLEEQQPTSQGIRTHAKLKKVQLCRSCVYLTHYCAPVRNQDRLMGATGQWQCQMRPDSVKPLHAPHLALHQTHKDLKSFWCVRAIRTWTAFSTEWNGHKKNVLVSVLSYPLVPSLVPLFVFHTHTPTAAYPRLDTPSTRSIASTTPSPHLTTPQSTTTRIPLESNQELATC